MDSIIILVFQLAVLIMSIVIHEVAHGWMAYHLGDHTAEYFGRLTLNPLKHLDFWGSFVVPFTLYFLTGGQFVFGWAKPVPYNPYNLRDQKYGSAKVAAAGPGANLFTALVFGLILRFGSPFLSVGLVEIFGWIIFINLLLGVFNLVPIPPLDGSKILFTFIPYSLKEARVFLERFGLVILLLVIFFALDWLLPFVFLIYYLIVGKSIPFL